MKTFIVRVELHDAKYNDYERLHELMKNKGYSQNITDGTGRYFKLPPAEYVAENKPFDCSVEKVRNEVISIAESVRTSFGVLAIESAGLSWRLTLA